MKKKTNHLALRKVLASVGIIASIGAVAYGGYYAYDTIADKNKEITQLSTQLETNATLLTERTEQLGAYKQLNQSITTERDNLNASVNTLNTQITALKLSVSELKQERDNLQEQIDNNPNATQVEELNKKKAELEAQLAEKEQNITNLTNNKAELEEQVNILNGKIDTLNGKMDDLTNEINTLKQDADGYTISVVGEGFNIVFTNTVEDYGMDFGNQESSGIGLKNLLNNNDLAFTAIHYFDKIEFYKDNSQWDTNVITKQYWCSNDTEQYPATMELSNVGELQLDSLVDDKNYKIEFSVAELEIYTDKSGYDINYIKKAVVNYTITEVEE